MVAPSHTQGHSAQADDSSSEIQENLLHHVPTFTVTATTASSSSAEETVHLDTRFGPSLWIFLPVFRLLSVCRRFNISLDRLILPARETAIEAATRLDPCLQAEFSQEAREAWTPSPSASSTHPTATQPSSRPSTARGHAPTNATTTHTPGPKATATEIDTGIPRPSVHRALRNAFGRAHDALAIWRLLAMAMTYLGGYYFLKRILQFIEDYSVTPGPQGNPSLGAAHGFAAALFASTLIGTMSTQQLAFQATRQGVAVRAALIVATYRKALRLNASSVSPGDVVSLVADDCNRVAEALIHKHYIWSAAVETLVVVTLAFVELRLSALPALGIFLLTLLPVQYALGVSISRSGSAMAEMTGARVRRISEILVALRLIKFYAWEIHFRDRVNRVREKEMRLLWRTLSAKAWSFTIIFGAPIAATLACLEMNRALLGDSVMRATHVFVIVSIFNALRFPWMMLPLALRSYLSTTKAYTHFDAFFSLPDAPALGVSAGLPPPLSDPTLLVCLENADFEWGHSVKPTLSFLSLNVHQGELVAIVGDVGSGKSSLLAALMGQLRHTQGTAEMYIPAQGAFAYVAPEPWLVRATLRENIVFGRPWDSARYAAVIHACALNPELARLARGDATEIADGGGNLSVPQRQRVALARAAYGSSPLLLLDDPVRGMDATAARFIVQSLLKGPLMQGRGIVLVTHQLHLLSLCDYILLLRGGTAAEEGSYEDLLGRPGVGLAAMVQASQELEATAEEESGGDSALGSSANPVGGSHPLASSASEEGCLPMDNGGGGASVDPYLVDELITELDQKHGGWVPSYDPLASGIESALDSGTGAPAADVTISFAEPHIPSRSGQDDEDGAIRFNPVDSSQATISHLQNLLDKRTADPTGTVPPVPGQPLRAGAAATANITLNEATLTRYIETRQTLHGMPTGLVEGADRVSKAMERHQLTIHSLHAGDESALGVSSGVAPSAGGGPSTRKDTSIWNSYRLYLARKPGLWITVAGVGGVFFLAQALRVVGDFWLREYTEDVSDDVPGDIPYLTVWAGLMGGCIIALIARGYLFVWAVVAKSRSLHRRIFLRVLRAPMAYFEHTPVARILSVFARHQYRVDEHLTDALLLSLQLIPLILGAIIAVTIILPWTLIPVAILISLVFLLYRWAREAELQLGRLEAESKPPLFALVSSTIEGLSSIRAYGVEGRFSSIAMRRIDATSSALYAGALVRGALALWTEVAVALYVYSLSLLLIEFRHHGWGNIDGPGAGLALTQALQLLLFAAPAVAAAREVHDVIGSVGELVKYAGEVPTEAAAIIRSQRPAPGWPMKGEIEFHDATLRYHRFGVAVLKRVSFRIRGKEKVGIVGRTGSGKTTLVMALLRMVELAEGAILIDGVDIGSLGLQDLRSRIAVLAQEPVLFQGTVRSNLDPFGIRTDEEIWAALRAAHLFDKIRSHQGHLDAPITDNGKGYSLGQRQLLCVARAILARCRILILDEATSAVDAQTDALIQETIRRSFRHCTVIKIAHRLGTIVDCDRVLVMEGGRAIEFDTPLALLNKPKGFFARLVAQAGPEAAERFKDRVKEAVEKRKGAAVSGEEGGAGGKGKAKGSAHLVDGDGTMSETVSGVESTISAVSVSIPMSSSASATGSTAFQSSTSPDMPLSLGSVFEEGKDGS